jgi:Sec7-like guanine-nucleotide exchange factor
VAFSEYCHGSCVEGRRGVLENPEVNYLLTFSIIMLNTDRHNPNIRADRRMTLEQFIRNNTNYGKDVNQTIPLSKEFLESIYFSISEFPIRTEGNEISATVSAEVWNDMQMQAKVKPEKSVLLTTCSNQLEFVVALKDIQKNKNDEKTLQINGKDKFFIASKLLESSAGISEITSAYEWFEKISGFHWLFDRDIFDCTWISLFSVGISVFEDCHSSIVNLDLQFDTNALLNQNQNEYVELETILEFESSKKGALKISNKILVDFLKSVNFFKIHFLVDCVILLLVEYAGILNVSSNFLFS